MPKPEMPIIVKITEFLPKKKELLLIFLNLLGQNFKAISVKFFENKTH